MNKTRLLFEAEAAALSAQCAERRANRKKRKAPEAHLPPLFPKLDSVPGVSKQCSNCGEMKPVEEFSVESAKNDGLQSYCKACHKLGMRRYRAENPEPYREQCRRWEVNNPHKRAATSAVMIAARSGCLVNPGACWHCGASPAEAHHASYAPDMRLAVTWVCRPCHAACHRQNTEA